jgi:ADP-heptose:LPS heptosyltransferase
MITRANEMQESAILKSNSKVARQACQKIMQVNNSNRVLLGMTQGIGNAILVTPLIQALTSMKLEVDIINDGLIRGAEKVLVGLPNVRVIKEEAIDPKANYLLGLQTLWPYQGLEKYVSQVRIAGNIHEMWKDNIPAHEVEVNMSLAYSLKFEGEIPPLYCYSDPVKIERDGDRKIIGIHICKRYSHQFYANRRLYNPLLIAEAIHDAGHDVIIVGHEGCVTDEEKDKYPYFGFHDGLNLTQTAGLIKELDCMVNEDSGIMHVTAAVDTPQVTIFGPTSWVKNRAYSDKAMLVRRAVACITCQYTERQNNCFTNICMDVTPSYVLECVNKLLEQFPK